MRIAIDGRELCGRVTGVGRYLAHLLQAWDGLDEALSHRFVLLLPSATTDRSDPPTAPGQPETGLEAEPDSASGWEGALRERLSLRRLPMEVRLVPGGRGTWWEQVRLPRALAREDFDVLFAPAYTAPAATRVPVVVTVHDVSFLAHPEWFAPRTRLRRKLVTASSVRRARRVIAVAEFTRREIVERLGVSREKVLVIPHGLSQVRAAASPAAPDRRPGDEGHLVLFVGSVFNRRHVPELIEAFARVAASRPGIRLEIVGDNRTYPPQDLDDLAARRGVGPLTTVRSYVTDDDLADLYQAASVFVFLSDYEGFGFTPLEALAAGVPILVGDTPVAREVYGEAAAFVPTTDVAAIAAKLDRLLGDGEARRALLSQAPGVLGRYSWDRAGRQTLAALEEAARA